MLSELATSDDCTACSACFVDALPSDARDAVLDFLSDLTSDVAKLSRRIAHLDAPTLASLTATTVGSQSPLRVLLRLILSLRGAEVLSEFAVALIGATIEETVPMARDAATFSGQAAPLRSQTPPSGVAASRERELDSFVLDVVEAITSLGVHVKGPQLEPGDDDKLGAGPFALGRPFETVMLQLVHEARDLRAVARHSVELMREPGNLPIREGSVASTGSSAWNTVAGAVSSGASLIMSTPSVLFGTAPETPDVPPVSAPPELPFSSIGRLLTRSATRLLETLAASDGSQMALPQAIAAKILAQHFPVTSRPAAHRKGLILLVVRSYLFGWFRQRLSRLGSGSCREDGPADLGVAFDELTSVSSHPATAFEDVWLDPREEQVGLIFALHRRAYAAVTEAAGASDKLIRDLLTGARTQAELDEVKALRRAARALVHAFGGLRTWNAAAYVSKPTASTPPSSPIRSVALSIEHLLLLWDGFGSVVASTPSVSSPPVTPSFKRRASSQATSPASDKADLPTSDRQQRIAFAFDQLKSVPRQATAEDVDPLRELWQIWASSEGKLGVEMPWTTSTDAFEPTLAAGTTWLGSSKSARAAPSEGGLRTTELEEVRNGVRLLFEQPGASPNGNLLEAFRCAADRARTQHRFLVAKQLDAVVSTLHKNVRAAASPELLTAIAAPWRQRRVNELRRLEAVEERLVELDRRMALLDQQAHVAQENINRSRMLVFYAALRSSDRFKQLRKDISRLNEGHNLRNATKWRAERSLPDALVADDESLQQTLILVEELVTAETQPAALAKSPLFARQRAELEKLALVEPERPVSMVSSFFASGSSLLFSAPTPAPVESSPDVDSPDSTLLALQAQITALAVSDLGLSRLRAPDGQALGADSWVDFGPTKSADQAAAELLRRFAHHPSPGAKIDAIFDLELLLAAGKPDVVSPPSSRHSKRPSDHLRDTSEALMQKIVQSPRIGGPTTDQLILAFEDVLKTEARPELLYANLQLTLSLTPSNILVLTPAGKALLDFSLAAMSLKADRIQEQVTKSIDALSTGLESDRSRARKVIRYAAREGNETALGMLDSLGLGK